MERIIPFIKGVDVDYGLPYHVNEHIERLDGNTVFVVKGKTFIDNHGLAYFSYSARILFFGTEVWKGGASVSIKSKDADSESKYLRDYISFNGKKIEVGIGPCKLSVLPQHLCLSIKSTPLK